MIRSLYRTQGGEFRTDLKADEISAALGDTGGLLWVDFVGEPPEACEPILRETFGFHPLAIEDALHQTHVSKVDDWTEYLYVVLLAVAYHGRGKKHDGSRVDTSELDVFLGRTYIVTHSEEHIPAVERVWAACQQDEHHLRNGADHVLYNLASELAGQAMSTVDDLAEAVDEIEREIFGKPTADTLEEIFALRRAALRMRRTLSPERDALRRLAHDDYAVIDARDRAYFRDVYDHLVRLYDVNEGLCDLATDALDTYLSVVNNRMNEAIRTLAVITTLFMPISFLAGFFGMNFFGFVVPLGGGVGTRALETAVVLMVALPVGLYLWIRRRGLL